MGALAETVLVLGVLLLHCILDRRLWGTTITPGCVLLGGYALVASAYCIVRFLYDVFDVSAYTFMVLVLVSVLSMVASIGAAFLFQAAGGLPRDPRGRAEFATPSGSGALGWLVITWTAIVFVQSVRVAIDAGGLWSDESEAALGYGIIGHARVLLSLVIIYYVLVSNSAAWIRALIVTFALVTLSLYPVKGWTIVAGLGVILALVVRGNLTGLALVRAGVIALAIATAVFGLNYGARAYQSSAGNPALYDIIPWLLAHFVSYLLSGWAGFSAVVDGLDLSGDWSVLFAPMENLTALVTGGEYVSPISSRYVSVIAGHGEGGNVYSFWGSLMGYAGWIGIALGVVILVASYMMLGLALFTRSHLLRAASIYLLAVLGVGWFEYYFWHVAPLEIIGATAFLAGIQAVLRAAAV